MATIVREDIKGDIVPPQYIAEFLTRIGGKNPFGEPNYRVVHTKSRRIMRGGAWTEWAPGLSIQERGGMIEHKETGLLVPSSAKPERVVIEMRWVRKYVPDFEGWLLERWVPASFYGGQSAWNGLTLPNHPEIQLLGPYPAHGDYECCSSIEPDLPSLDRLQQAVQFQSRCDESRIRGDISAIVAQRVYEAALAYDEETAKIQAENEARIKDILSPFRSTSLEAGRFRSRMAEKAGVREHYGN